MAIRHCHKDNLLYEFDIHRIRGNRQPTALVSVTNRPLEVLNRALAKYYRSYEDTGKIWIVIIRLPDGRNSNGLHHAQGLAEEMEHPDAEALKYEYVFEWEIPQEHVAQRVSVKTLIDRGIERMIDPHYFANGVLSFGEMRNALVKEILDSDHPYGIGRWLGSLAQAFGAGAYTEEIAIQILQNCLSGGYVDEDHQYVYFCCADFCGGLGFSTICDIEFGIRDQLDW